MKLDPDQIVANSTPEAKDSLLLSLLDFAYREEDGAINPDKEISGGDFVEFFCERVQILRDSQGEAPAHSFVGQLKALAQTYGTGWPTRMQISSGASSDTLDIRLVTKPGSFIRTVTVPTASDAAAASALASADLPEDRPETGRSMETPGQPPRTGPDRSGRGGVS